MFTISRMIGRASNNRYLNHFLSLLHTLPAANRLSEGDAIGDLPEVDQDDLPSLPPDKDPSHQTSNTLLGRSAASNKRMVRMWTVKPP